MTPLINQRIFRRSMRLNTQINDLDWQLHMRRNAARQHQAELRAGIHAKRTSPVTTVFVLATGFILGKSNLLRRHGSKTGASVAGKGSHVIRSSAALLMRMHSALTFLNVLLAFTEKAVRPATVPTAVGTNASRQRLPTTRTLPASV